MHNYRMEIHPTLTNDWGKLMSRKQKTQVILKHRGQIRSICVILKPIKVDGSVKHQQRISTRFYFHSYVKFFTDESWTCDQST